MVIPSNENEEEGGEKIEIHYQITSDRYITNYIITIVLQATLSNARHGPPFILTSILAE